MSKIPQFQTLDELIAFWETHDFTDYMDVMEEVPFEEGAPGRKTMSLRVLLDESTWEQLCTVAAKRGVPSDRLAREWLRERLNREMAIP